MTDIVAPPDDELYPTTPNEWRARCLLALSLLNHRAKADGLHAVDVEAVRVALHGGWV